MFPYFDQYPYIGPQNHRQLSALEVLQHAREIKKEQKLAGGLPYITAEPRPAPAKPGVWNPFRGALLALIRATRSDTRSEPFLDSEEMIK